MRVHRPEPDVLAFYDGRVPGASVDGDWREAAWALGIASYAIVGGDEALVYDSHMSCAHAAAVRATLAGLGVRRFTLLLSHWHRDHGPSCGVRRRARQQPPPLLAGLRQARTAYPEHPSRLRACGRDRSRSPRT